MSSDQLVLCDKDKTEYDIAVSQFRHFATQRRQDMAFATTVQAGVLAVVKDHLLTLDTAHSLLTVVAFLVLAMGCNNERRLSAYMMGYMKRARQIEKQFGMMVLHTGFDFVQKKRFLISNRKTFPLYYYTFGFFWLAIWILNLWR